MEREIAYLILTQLPGLGPAKINKLVKLCGHAERVLETKIDQLRAAVTEDLARIVYNWKDHVDLNSQLGKIEASGVQLVCREDSHYPIHLQEIANPPPLLYVLGKLEDRDRHSLAVVGTRRLSHYGRESCKQISFQLAHAGYTIVSGLAYGIDTVAHEAALAAKGRTIAVLGSGLGHIYPSENRPLAKRIAENGAVISQFPFDTRPDGKQFPIRNRTVSGMTLGTLVIEGNKKSGSMITAKMALEQNRNVFAVPGPIDRPASGGPNSLIQDGAKLVTCADDIASELTALPLKSVETPPTPVSSTVKLEGDEAKVYEALSDEVLGIEDLVQKTGLPSSKVLSTLMRLEMRRMARQLPGMTFEKLI